MSPRLMSVASRLSAEPQETAARARRAPIRCRQKRYVLHQFRVLNPRRSQARARTKRVNMPAEQHVIEFEGGRFLVELDHGNALKLLTDSGKVLPAIPAGANTAWEHFKTPEPSSLPSSRKPASRNARPTWAAGYRDAIHEIQELPASASFVMASLHQASGGF